MISVVQDPRERNYLRQVLDSIDTESQESGETAEADDIVIIAMKAYNDYKIQYKKNIGFDPKAQNFFKHLQNVLIGKSSYVSISSFSYALC